MKTRTRTLTPSTLRAAAGRLIPVWTAAALIGLSPAARAQVQPQGGQVVSGSGSIQQNGNFTGITAGNNTIINWQSFNIGQGQTVQFFQPSATSRVLNRVTGPDPSTIAGSLIANGIVYIANPAGVYFAHGSLVNVGGIYAAAGQITNADFLNNVNRFTTGPGSVQNHGTINAGAAHLIGRQAANFGTINAPGGVVTMTAGSDVYIGEQGGQIFARVQGGGAGDTGVNQAGQINAKGGQVVLGAGDLYAMAIDHGGRTQASRIKVEGGVGGVVSVSGTLDASNREAGGVGGDVEVLGHRVGLFGGTIDASGHAGGGSVKFGGDWQGQGDTKRAEASYISRDARISADAISNGNGGRVVVWADRYTNYQGKISARGGAQGGNGGSVETSGKDYLHMNGSVDAAAPRGRAGQWLLDPTDVTLSNAVTSGGTLGGGGVFTPDPVASANVNLTEITNALSSGTSVTITTASAGAGNGDITLVDPLSVTMTGGGATLILNADRDIVINNTITGTGAAGNELGLAFTAGRNVSVNNAISLNGGAFSINAPNTIFVNASIGTGGGNFSVAGAATTRLASGIDAGTGDVTFASGILLTGNSSIAGNDLTFNGVIDSDSLATPRDLVLNTTGNGVTRFNASVGNVADLGTLTTNADGTTVINAPFVKGTAVTFNNAVQLFADTVVRGLTSVTFNGTIDSEAGESNNLVVNSPLTAFNGSVGNAANDTFLGIIQTNAAGTTTINAPFVKGEIINFEDAVILGVDTVVRGSTRVTFGSTVDSEAGESNNLVVNSPLTTFNGSLGDAAVDTFLGIIQTNAAGTTTINAPFVKGEIINFEDAVILGMDTVVRGSTRVTFGSTVDSQAGESNNLVVNSPLTTFAGSVGNAAVDTFLGIIQTNAAGTTQINAPFVKGEIINFEDQVILGENVVVRGSTSVTFGSTVDSLGGGTFNLIVNSPLTFFNGDVGNASVDSFLGLLQTNAAGTTTLNAGFFKAERINFEDAVILGQNVVTRGSTSVRFGSTIDSESGEANNLIVNSPLTRFDGRIGRGTGGELGLLQTNAAGVTTINGESIQANILNFEDAVVLGQSVSITAGTSLTFGGTVDSEAGEANSLTIASPQTRFAGDVGQGTGGRLGTLAANSGGDLTIDTAAVSAGEMVFSDRVIIAADTTLNATTSIAFNATVNSATGEANDLHVEAPTVTFLGQVGSQLDGELGRLTTGASGLVNLNTTAMQAAEILFGGDVVLGANVTLIGNTSVTFEGKVDSQAGGERNLIVNSPLTVFNRSIGDSATNTRLGILRTNISGTTTFGGGLIRASVVEFNDALILKGDTRIDATATATFAAIDVDSASTEAVLRVNSAFTTFGGRVGNGPAALTGLSIDGTGTTLINTDRITALETIFGNTLVIGVDTTITSATSATFQAVRSEFNEFNDLTVQSPSATFNGAVGDGTGLAMGRLGDGLFSVTAFNSTVDATEIEYVGRVTLNGGTIRTLQDQTYSGTFFLGQDATLEGRNITFNSSVNSLVDDRSLAVNSTGGGTTRFNGAVGNLTPLRSLSTNADGITILASPEINIGGDAVFNDAVTLGANVSLAATGITFGQTVNSDSTARALNVSSTGSGITLFVGAVGDVNPLLRLTTGSEGTTRIRGGAVTTTLSQAYNNDTIIDGVVSTTTLAGGSISFGGTLNGDVNTTQNLVINTTNNGQTVFSGDVGLITPLTSITTNADGSTRFFASAVRTSGDQTYADAVALGADVTFTGNDITFNSTIDATPLLGPVNLVVNTISSGITTFNGTIGGTTALKSITTNADGSTRIGANINTEGGSMLFGDRVLIFRDSTLTDTNGLGVAFGSTIDSEGTPQALSVLVDIDSNASIASPTIASIRLGGNIGSTLALRTLRLGNNRTTVPTVATIVAGLTTSNTPISGFDLKINTTGAFAMGAFNKMTVIGNVTINAGGPSAIGDISALGNISVTAPSIAIRTRPGGLVLGNFGSSLINSTDTGVDFVAGGSIFFSTTPTLLGGFGFPSFATPSSVNISPNLSGFAQRAFGQPITANLMFNGGTYLDLRSTGPSNVNISNVIAGEVPTPDQAGTLALDAGVDNEEINLLGQMGITTRSLDEKEFIEFLLGRRLVNDAGADPSASDYAVTINRLPSSVVRRVLQSYREVFWKETYNPETGESTWEPQTDRVGRVLSAAWAEYAGAAGAKADALGFRAYLEALPAQAEALNYLNSLRELFSELGYLGLTSAENRIARDTILRSVNVKGMTPEQLEEACTARRLGAPA
ncbi:MAG: filamentous hemagglutinin N-terminal domain-containing protein [Phycisphaeraceae bacterium]|nr:filamentous hemagglutinin N-terminal domain-containing protein [Phycisphaeraceae bacterium]